jgi:16S rRNA (guanine(966)-N(2))-methyltransferase RsmD
MRIIAGRLRGLTLKMPRGIRPTSDKVREALFDILAEAVISTSVLDLFAGSGALGLEAISRGAKKVTFVDNNPKCIKVIKENIANLKLKTYPECSDFFGNASGCRRDTSERNFIRHSLELYNLDVFKAIKLFGQRNEKFDLILLDPPYYENLAKKSLISIEQNDILTRNALVMAEHYKKDKMPEEVGQLKLFKIKKYADTILSFYTNEPEGKK